jgi:fimbrial isopeptide formation D2 family protein/LPXTG-motif cell wall-anchored protein
LIGEAVSRLTVGDSVIQKKGMNYMKRKNGFKRLFAFIMAVMMLLSCMCTSSFADDETVTMTGTSSLTVSSMYANRDFALYQIFFGEMQKASSSETKTLIGIQWGISIKGHESELIAALKEATLPDGTANAVADDFKNISTSATANDVATVLIGISENADKVDAFAQIASNVLSGYDAEKVTANTGATAVTNAGNYHAVFSGIHDGYYLVLPVPKKNETETEVNATFSKIMLKVAGPSTVYTKTNSVPTIDKRIVKTDESGKETLTRFDNGSIGDEVTFKLTSAVPGMDGYSKYFFVVKDELTAGLDFQKVTKITIGDEEIKNIADLPEGSTDTKYFTVTDNETPTLENATSAFKIVFHNFIQYKTGEEIAIYYTAKITPDAVVGNSSSNINSAKLEYSNNPNYNYKGIDEPNDEDKKENEKNGGTIGDTKWARAYVYTTGIDLIKQDKANGERLEGAVFEIKGTKLNTVVVESDQYDAVAFYGHANADTHDSTTKDYYQTVNKAMTTVAPTSATESDYDKEYIKYNKVDGEYVVALDGAFYKIKDGDYSTELEDGKTYEQGFIVYHQKGDSTTTITKQEAETVSYKATVGSNGALTVSGLGEGEYDIYEVTAPTGYNPLTEPIHIKVTFEEPGDGRISEGCTWKYVVDGSGKEANQKGLLELIVENSMGSSLPSTGGIGTTVFYVFGSALLIGAAVLLITKRRMAREED